MSNSIDTRSGHALCVVPAKARSTRFPGKNTALLAGKPLVVWAVEAALASGVFDCVMVSTDDEGIARLARSAGAEVPFIRDPALAADDVEVPAVIRSVLHWYDQHSGRIFEEICILQPTSPLRTAQDIRAAKSMLDADPQADGVISVSPYAHHPHWALRIEGGRLVAQFPQSATASRQDLPPLYHPDGTVFWHRRRSLLSERPVYERRMLAYLTPARSSLDIDYPDDLDYAQWRITQTEGWPAR